MRSSQVKVRVAPARGALSHGDHLRIIIIYNVLAVLLPRWQQVRKSRATQPRGTDAPDWVTTSAAPPTIGDSDSFNFEDHGLQLAPNLIIMDVRRERRRRQ